MNARSVRVWPGWIESAKADDAAFEKAAKVGVLATEGTASSGAYSDIFKKYGIEVQSWQ